MVSTRRQTSGLAPPRSAVPDEVEHDVSEDDFEGYESSVTDDGDSDLDYTGGNSIFEGQHASKRLKTTTESIKASSRKKGGLGGIIDMPLDILFEIFSRVTPSDLLNLARTNKVLRQTLMSKKAITVWKAALQETEAPENSSNFSEPQWANLLFGERKCQVCSTRSAHRVDFGLLRRVCTSCLKTNLLSASKFHVRFPDYDVLIMDLLPHTNIGGWSHGCASSTRYYWLRDIYDMAITLAQYQQDVQMRKPGAQRTLDDFKRSRIEFVAMNTINARKYNDWMSQSAKKSLKEKRERIDKRYNAIKTRLLEMGYIEADMHQLRKLTSVTKDSELTDHGWRSIHRAIIANVDTFKVERISRERAGLISSRKNAVKELYTTYKRALVPTQWAYHPDVEHVYELEPFVSLINDPSDSKTEQQHCRNALQMVPNLVESLNERKKAGLLQLVKSNQDSSSPSNEDTNSHACLDLAASVFQCSSRHCQSLNRPIIAWQRTISHSCYAGNRLYGNNKPSEPVFAFSNRGSQAVHSLAILLKLDAQTALPAHFDMKVARFVCLHCNLCTHAGIHGRKALTWRDCVAHFVEATGHPTPHWNRLSLEETADVKRRETFESDPADNDHAWSCNHCAMYLDAWARRQQVVQHTKDTHGKVDPVEDVDFFYDQQRGRTPRKAVFFGVAAASNAQVTKKLDTTACYQCKHCPLTATRRFQLQGVTAHIKAKHGVDVPMMDRDMQKT